MRKSFTICTLLVFASMAYAQTMKIHLTDGSTATYTTAQVNYVEFIENDNQEDYHAYVDLGLPSGLLWATCNVGANSPEEYGDYFAWGETETKSEYNWSTYKWCNGSSSTLTKYNTESYYDYVDNKTVLDFEDDVAHVNWGGNWRMPTRIELVELRNECTWVWTSINGVNGYKVIGTNGNTIFFPAAGFRSNTGCYGLGTLGCYWSSSLVSIYPLGACCLIFESDGCNVYDDGRNMGYSVRPVC